MSSSPPSSSAAENSEPFEYDSTFLHARREAIVIFLLWVVALLWTVPYCYFHGYMKDVDPDQLETILGIPSWLFWGVGVPWLVADLFTMWFCFSFMQDDDLGQAHEGADIEEEIAERHAAADSSGKEAQ